MPGLAVQPTFIAKTPPRKWDKSKRPYSVVKQTPTPKSKIKKGLFLSPGGRQFQNTNEKKPGHIYKDEQEHSHMFSCQSHALCTYDPTTGAGDVLPWRGQVQFKDQCTQTKEITESFDVKIIANYAGNE
eukprot:XP_011423331.1 PREDICTED: uncharacterized protein LOC105325457 [Crassostrea gigas]